MRNFLQYQICDSTVKLTMYNNMKSQSLQYHYDKLIYQQKNKNAKKKNEFKRKHHMVSLEIYPSPENFTQPLVPMVVIFCMSQ